MTQLLILFLWLAACALQDLYKRQIANTLTLGGMALAVLYLLWSGHTWLGAPQRSPGGAADCAGADPARLCAQ